MVLLIVADDLTGAADSAARCHHGGLPATVYVHPAPPPWPPGAVAFSTDSRFLTPAAAAEKVKRLLAPFSHEQAIWYKKIDSTLRGNIGAEVDAMLSVLATGGRAPVALICPAFPAQGRGLVNGELAFAQSHGQVRHLPSLLAEQTSRPQALLALATVRSGQANLAGAIAAQTTAGAQILVADALTDADLASLLSATQRVHPDALWCGSAGLIEPLARWTAVQGQSELITASAPVRLRSPLLGIVGSGSAMSHRQLELLGRQEDVSIMQLDPVGERPVEDGRVAWRAILLHLAKPEPAADLDGPAARLLATQLARRAVHLAHQVQPGCLLLVGGDTTVATLEQLGINRLTVVTELMPGIPLLDGVDGKGRVWPIITKAGNFGLQRIVELLGR
jgi:4-hydroxythreonine-4-phosphate dehydrogenase